MQEEQNENQAFDDSQEKSELQEETIEDADSKEALQLQINELKDQYMQNKAISMKGMICM